MDAWKARDSFREGTDREAWLTTLCLNRCRMRLRARQREKRALEALAREPRRASGAGVEEADFRKALAELPETEREAFLLIVVQGMTSEKAGQVLDCSAASARSYLARARKTLVNMLRHHL